MKNTIVLIMLVMSASAFAQNVKVTDYIVPVSKATTLRFDGSWDWSEVGNSVSSNNAQANMIYRTFYSSLPIAWFINIDAFGKKNLGTYSHDVSFDASFRKYIWEDKDWFGFSRLTAEHTNDYKQINSDLTIGFGIGRYIDATALAKAVRIENHLLADKVINDFLSKDIMIRIANIIERESEYKDLYGETYETRWFDDIEKEIKTSDVLVGSTVGALGILRMRQVLFGINERVNPRYYGWDVSVGFLFPLTTYDKSPTGNPNLTLSGRYAFPLSWKTQVNSTAEAFTPMDSSFFKKITARVGVDFIYELSNRVNFVSSYRIGLVKPQDVKAEITHNLNASFWYYLENNIYLTISGDFSKVGSSPKVVSTRVGLQYNLF
ncbi:MAG: hypothetical protein Q8903_11915 [Bacteroidota bacterium]|nr:hypothetical protein [Bacteroidota bacterium]